MKKQALEFIHKNNKTYGLMGSNIQHNPPKYQALTNGSGLGFSKDDHWAWGYNGISFNSRVSSTCMYWTDYTINGGPESDVIQSMQTAMRNALTALEQQCIRHVSKLLIVNRGRMEDYAAVEQARISDIPFQQVVLNFNDKVNYSYDGRVNTIVLDMDEQFLLETINDTVPWLRCRDINTIINIAILNVFDVGYQVVFPNTLSLMNHNWIPSGFAGPINWALEDMEEDSALAKYIWFNERNFDCIPNLAVWSPDLMQAQLGNIENELIDCTEQYADGIMKSKWLSLSPFKEENIESTEWLKNSQDRINELHDGGKSNEKWYTPLPALLDTLRIEHNYGKIYDEAYGSVF
jgi:hypothetical protein